MLRFTNPRGASWRVWVPRLGILLVLVHLALGSIVPAVAAGGGGGGGHGGDHHEVLYMGDDDNDGTPNWRDRRNGAVLNDETYVCGDLGAHAFNLALFVGVVVYLARRPMGDTFRQRALDIRKGLTESARARDEAHQRHQELVARLSAIEQEVEGLEATAKREAEAEEKNLVERAEQAAQRIAEQAERSIQDEARRARHALRKEAVDLAVQLAEQTLSSQVASADQQKLAKEFLASLKGDEEASRGQ